jgi:DNA invertase Pin-like site-specific DNA recombinase
MAMVAEEERRMISARTRRLYKQPRHAGQSSAVTVA